MKVLAIIFCFLVWLPAAKAATVPPLDFRITVTWDFENESSEFRDLGSGHVIGVNSRLLAASRGFSFQTDSLQFDGISGTTVSFFGSLYEFQYDFASGSGSVSAWRCCYLEEYVFDQSGGSYKFDADWGPGILAESADLTNVSVTVESLSQVPLPVGGLLLLTGVLGLSFQAGRRTKPV